MASITQCIIKELFIGTSNLPTFYGRKITSWSKFPISASRMYRTHWIERHLVEDLEQMIKRCVKPLVVQHSLLPNCVIPPTQLQLLIHPRLTTTSHRMITSYDHSSQRSRRYTSRTLSPSSFHLQTPIRLRRSIIDPRSAKASTFGLSE